MELEIQTQGEHTIILPRGEIDFHSSPRLREQILSALDYGRNRALIKSVLAVGARSENLFRRVAE